MEKIIFTKEQKAQMFDEIAKEYYNKNFGHLSKSEIDLKMFKFYFETLMGENDYGKGTIDFHKCSDYNISKELGISQQRVRNFKIKYQLSCTDEFKWQNALSELTKNAKYDKATRKVTINIPDPNLYIEIQNFIEENGAYVEKQLNSKILQICADDYIVLILAIEDEENRKNIIKKMKAQFKEQNKNNSVFEERDIWKNIIEQSGNVLSVVNQICGMVSPGNALASALLTLLTKWITT